MEAGHKIHGKRRVIAEVPQSQMSQVHAEKMNYAGASGEFFRVGVQTSSWLRVAARGRVRHGRAGDACGRGVLSGHAGRAADGLVSHAREFLIPAVNEAR